AAVAATLRRLTGATSDLVFLDLPRRVAKVLLSQPRDGGGVIRPPLTQEQLAQHAAGTRQSVNAAPRGFDRRGGGARRRRARGGGRGGPVARRPRPGQGESAATRGHVREAHDEATSRDGTRASSSARVPVTTRPAASGSPPRAGRLTVPGRPGHGAFLVKPRH